MKRHATFFKNIAAFIMLIALIALLLPLFKITTVTESTTISGLEVLKIGMDAGYEYYSKGKIDNDYVLGDSLTWEDIKDSVTYVVENSGLKNVAVGGAIASLPIVFCFLSMLFTFMAQGKKTMVLSTLLSILTFLESIALIIIFFKLQQLLIPYIDMTLLVGMYAFTALSGVALMILGLLWVTGSFFKSKDKNQDSDRKKDKGKKRGGFSALDKRREKRKKKKRHKKKRKKHKKDKEASYNHEENPKSQNRDKVHVNKHDEVRANITGRVIGLTGMYEGIDLEILKLENGTFTIGTTQEAIDAIQKGTMEDIDKTVRANCVIAYSEQNKQYIITSHSVTKILLKTDVKGSALIQLKEGESQIIGSNTLVYIGDYNNSIRLA